jgi:DNA-binding Lrp family transcriptional regulator
VPDKGELRRLAVLAAIQRNNKTKAAEIAKGLGVGHQRVSTIINEANADGHVRYNKAILDPHKFGLSDLFFIQVKLLEQNNDLRTRLCPA